LLSKTVRHGCEMNRDEYIRDIWKSFPLDIIFRSGRITSATVLLHSALVDARIEWWRLPFM
jgi:hypothetical protein